jgi:hypothetical protein
MKSLDSCSLLTCLLVLCVIGRFRNWQKKNMAIPNTLLYARTENLVI